MSTEQGLGLRDIAPVTENVKVSDEQSVKVKGLSAAAIFVIFERFPDLHKWMAGEHFDAKVLMVKAPQTISAIIAAATGTPGDEQDERIATELPVEVQLDILEAVGRLTFRSGFGPFASRVVALSRAVASVRSGREPDTNSQPVSNTSSPQATDTTQSGS